MELLLRHVARQRHVESSELGHQVNAYETGADVARNANSGGDASRSMRALIDLNEQCSE
jgi:hypothetical protein